MKKHYTQHFKKASLLLGAFLLFLSNGYAQLNGTYTINKAAATGGTNYASFAAAVSALSASGVSGPVTFNVVANSGPYTEQITINNVPTTSSTNTVTFNGNGEAIEFNATAAATAHTILLNGARFFTFRNLKVNCLNASNGRGFHLTNASNNNTIEGCTITMPNMTGITITTNAYISLSIGTTTMLTYGNPGENNVIRNNKMLSGSTTVNRGPMYGITLIYETTGITLIRRNTIENNEIRDFYHSGLFVYYPFQQSIRKNEIHNTGATNVGTKYGMYIWQSNKGGDHFIDSNFIHDLTNNTASAVVQYGIYYYQSQTSTTASGTNGSNLTMTNNRIVLLNCRSTTYGIYNYMWYNTLNGDVNISNNTTTLTNHAATSTMYGIYNYGYYSYYIKKFMINGNTVDINCLGAIYAIYNLWYYSTPSEDSWLTNNVMKLRNNSLTYGLMAMHLGITRKCHQTYNTLYSDDYTTTTSATSTKYLYYCYYSDGDFKNNICMSEDNGGTVYAIYRFYGATDFNNNNLFMNLSSANVFHAYNSTTNLASFTDYKSGMGGANDMSENPNFIDIVGNNFTPTQFKMVNKGTPVGYMNRDIRGAIRSATTPDIGAIEFFLDLGVSNFQFKGLNECGNYKENVTVTIKNNSPFPITGIPMAYNINGANKISEMVTASIKGNDTLRFTFKIPAEFHTPGANVLRVFLDASDDVLGNNQVSKSLNITKSPSGGSLTQGVNFPGTFYPGVQGGSKTFPDNTVPGREIEYTIENPTGLANGTYSSAWDMTPVFQTNGGMTITSGVSYTAPVGGNKGVLKFNPSISLFDSVIFVGVRARNFSTGCDSVFGRHVFVPHQPTVAFSAQNVCLGEVVSFKNLSTMGKGNMLQLWNFNDPTDPNSKSELGEPFYKYNNYGTYTVTLSVWNAAFPQFVTTVSNQVTVAPVPEIEFKVLNACQGLPIVFDNKTTLPVPGSISYVWSYGGAGSGDPVTIKSPKYTYSQAGGYKVTLTATANGCASSLTKNANQFAKPKASFTSSGSCAKEEIKFNNTSNIPLGTTGFAWTYGDGNLSYLPNPAHKYATPGNKTVKLTAISEFGCRDSLTRVINIQETPVANFNFSNPCNLSPVNFTGTSTLPASGTNVYNWDFNGQGVSNNENPSFFFGDLGPKKVKLLVLNQNGCKSEIEREFNIKLQAKADFDAYDVCAGESVVFTNKSKVAGGNLNYEWRFGDGKTSILNAPKHTFANTSTTTFNITLVAKVPGGCADSIVRSVTVNAIPKTDFTLVRSGRLVTFNATGNLADAKSILWNFGDGNSSNSPNPVHNYEGTNTYKACFSVVNNAGCINSTCQLIEISTGVQNLGLNEGLFNAYPNPSQGVFTIEFSKPTTANMEIVDLYGHTLGVYQTSNEAHNFVLDLSNQPQGIYFVKVSDGASYKVQKLNIAR